jgi:hypothetical protein
MVLEWLGSLDVLAVLDRPGQLRVESGVSDAATCRWGNGGAEDGRDEAHGLLQVLGTLSAGTCMEKDETVFSKSCSCDAAQCQRKNRRRNKTVDVGMDSTIEEAGLDWAWPGVC